MTKLFFIALLLISANVYSQEWWDLKYHEGSDAGNFNNNSALQGNLHRDPKARNKDNVETKLDNGLFVQSKETKMRIAGMNEARKLAFERLKNNLANSGGVLVQCKTCDGRGARVCKVCDGNSYVECSVCHGAPNLECRACKGGGIVNDDTCKTCGGSGKSECKFCHGKPVMCTTCTGVGNIVCADCSGAGMFFEPRIFIDTLNSVDTLSESRSKNNFPHASVLTAAQEDSILRVTNQRNSEKLSKQKRKRN